MSVSFAVSSASVGRLREIGGVTPHWRLWDKAILYPLSCVNFLGVCLSLSLWPSNESNPVLWEPGSEQSDDLIRETLHRV